MRLLRERLAARNAAARPIEPPPAFLSETAWDDPVDSAEPAPPPKPKRMRRVGPRVCQEVGCGAHVKPYKRYCDVHQEIRAAMLRVPRVCSRAGCANEPRPGKQICESCRKAGRYVNKVRQCKADGCTEVVTGSRHYCRTCRAVRVAQQARESEARRAAKRAARRAANEPEPIPARSCLHCGALFQPRTRNTKLCSETCRAARNAILARAKMLQRAGLRMCPICGARLALKRSIVVDNGAAIRRVFRCTGDGCHGRAVTVERIEMADAG